MGLSVCARACIYAVHKLNSETDCLRRIPTLISVSVAVVPDPFLVVVVADGVGRDVGDSDFGD